MNTIDYIPRAGGCVVSKNVINKVAPVRWMVRHEPLNPMDNGWRVFSDIDTEEFIADSQNMTVVGDGGSTRTVAMSYFSNVRQTCQDQRVRVGGGVERKQFPGR